MHSKFNTNVAHVIVQDVSVLTFRILWSSYF